jgi:hypothetical protein
MSRHLIEKEKLREVWVGWDAPLGTFFAQIYAPQLPEDEEELIWEIGDRQREVTDLDELALALYEQGVTLRPETRARLAADEAEPWEPGPLQKAFGFTRKEGA